LPFQAKKTGVESVTPKDLPKTSFNNILNLSYKVTGTKKDSRFAIIKQYQNQNIANKFLKFCNLHVLKEKARKKI
jgi:hypothetical protein